MLLRIGCAPDVPLRRLQTFLGLLYHCVDFEVEVIHLPTGEQFRRIGAGDLDIGMLHDSGALPGIDTETVFRGEPLAAVVPVGHPAAMRGPAQLEALAGEVLLVVQRSAEPGVHTRVVRMAMGDGGPFRQIREAPGGDVRDLLFAVASGRGVALAARSALRGAGELGEIVATASLAARIVMPDTCLAWPAGGRPELAGLHAALSEIARELYELTR